MILKSTAFFNKRFKRIIEKDPAFIVYPQMKRALELSNEIITAFSAGAGCFELPKGSEKESRYVDLINYNSPFHKSMRGIFNSSERMETLFSYNSVLNVIIVTIHFFQKSAKAPCGEIILYVYMGTEVVLYSLNY